MSNLFVSLQNAGLAMRIFERGLAVVQNNVTNVNTPGYARQRLELASLRFEPDIGVSGGVAAAGIRDSRSSAAEEGVRRQLAPFADSQETIRQLERLEPVFQIGAGSGLAASLDSFFQSFSALSVTPNDASSRQIALERAATLAGSFNGVAQQLSVSGAQAETDLRDNVTRLNSLVHEVAGINHELRLDYRAQHDAGLTARLNNLIEEISTITQATVLRAEDGSISLYAGGQLPLVIGEREFPLSADTGSIPARILGNEGDDVTAYLRAGSIRSIVNFRNSTLVGLQADVDRLAGTVADTVNVTLGNGLDATGNPPSTPLFAYDSSAGCARSLVVNPLNPQDLALAKAGSPGGNGNALALSALGTAKQIDGYTFTQFYGTVAGRAGRLLDTAQEQFASRETLLAQARGLREELQSVNLDEEAVLLLQYQRAYEASATLVRTLDEMLDTAMSMIR